MPIFSYICKDCNEKFDLFIQGRKTDDKLVCTKCGSKNIQKVFSTFSTSSKSGSGDDQSNSCSTGTCPTGTCPF